MSFLSRLLGKREQPTEKPKQEEELPPLNLPPLHKTTAAAKTPKRKSRKKVEVPEAAEPGPKEYWLECRGIFGQEVAGEYYQKPNLKRICGAGRGNLDLRKDACLVPEKRNPYDKNAVRVDIDGLKVGYLPRSDARAFRKQLREVIAAGTPIMCHARIRRNDRGDEMYYDVYLELPELGTEDTEE